MAEDDSIELLTRQRYHGFQDRLRSQPRHLPYSLAVGPGFEPGVRLSAYERLAIFWFKPLTHSTVYFGSPREFQNPNLLNANQALFQLSYEG